ncbi:MAG: hypothetical protein J5778_10610 [Clostridiales bacterium]|nr:hypothetical protein [Clostridiales bacterium]
MDIDNTVKGKKDSKGTIVLKILGITGTVFFFLSYIPFFILSLVSLDGISEGMFGARNIYGWEAVSNFFMWMCIIPIYPVAVIYQIVWGIAYIRRKKKALKIAAASLVAVILIATAATCIIFRFREKARYEELIPGVRTYLKDKYGSDFADSAELTLYDYDAGAFKGKSPIFGTLSFELDHAPDGYYDDIINVFNGQNDKYEKDFRKYLDQKHGMTGEIHVQPHIASINFDGYNKGDDYSALFPATEYSIAGLQIELPHDEIRQERLIELTKKAIDEYIPKLGDHTLKFIMIYVRDEDSGSTVATIQIDFPGENTKDYTVIQIEPRISDDTPNTIWADAFFAEEL